MRHTLFKMLSVALLVSTLGCSSFQPVLHNSSELARAGVPHPPAAKILKMGAAPAIALGIFSVFVAVVFFSLATGDDSKTLVTPVLK